MGNWNNEHAASSLLRILAEYDIIAENVIRSIQFFEIESRDIILSEEPS